MEMVLEISKTVVKDKFDKTLLPLKWMLGKKVKI